MAYSVQDTVLNKGEDTVYVNIDYLSKAHIHAYIKDTEVSFAWDGNNIKLDTPIVSAATTIRIKRETPRNDLFIRFIEGAPFIRTNIDEQNKQFLFIVQEIVDGYTLGTLNIDLDMNGNCIVNLGDPIKDNDATNKKYVDMLYNHLLSLLKDLDWIKGDKGDQGIQGVQGIQGIKGDKGDTGATGLQGIQGVQGIQGAKGDTGSAGLQGIQGERGDQGIQGVQGEQGIQGIKGDKGDKGDQGNAVIVDIQANNYAFKIVDGHLYLVYNDNTTPPDMYINEDGHLMIRF